MGVRRISALLPADATGTAAPAHSVPSEPSDYLREASTTSARTLTEALLAESRRQVIALRTLAVTMARPTGVRNIGSDGEVVLTSTDDTARNRHRLRRRKQRHLGTRPARELAKAARASSSGPSSYRQTGPARRRTAGRRHRRGDAWAGRQPSRGPEELGCRPRLTGSDTSTSWSTTRGISKLGPVADGDVDGWSAMIDVNLRGVLYGVAAAMPVFRRQGPVDFVTTVSTAGLKIVPRHGRFMRPPRTAVRTVMDDAAAGVHRRRHPDHVDLAGLSSAHRASATRVDDPTVRARIRSNMDEFGLPPERRCAERSPTRSQNRMTSRSARIVDPPNRSGLAHQSSEPAAGVATGSLEGRCCYAEVGDAPSTRWRSGFICWSC